VLGCQHAPARTHPTVCRLIPHCRSRHGTFVLFPFLLPQSIAAIEGLHALFLKCFNPKRVDVGASEASRGVPHAWWFQCLGSDWLSCCFVPFPSLRRLPLARFVPGPPPFSVWVKTQFVCVSCLNPGPCLSAAFVPGPPQTDGSATDGALLGPKRVRRACMLDPSSARLQTLHSFTRRAASILTLTLSPFL
jgi:hypothetical protein